MKKKASNKKITPLTLEEFGMRLKEIRISKGYTSQENFAYDHEFSRIQYNKWERGGDIKLSSLIRLAEAFEMSLEELFKR